MKILAYILCDGAHYVVRVFASCEEAGANHCEVLSRNPSKKWYTNSVPGDEYVTDFSLEAQVETKPIEIVSG